MPPSVVQAVPINPRVLEGLPGAVLAVTAAAAIAYLLALYLSRLVRLVLRAVWGRSYALERLETAVRTPVLVVRRVAFAFLSVVLAFPALELLGYRTRVGPARETLLRWLFGAGVRIAAIALLAWILVRLAATVLANMEHEASQEVGRGAVERARRIHTLGTLVSNTVAVLITTAAVLMILRELRVDVVPLLAGAGIAGLAIGFGAQTLVKDIISGFFMILENQIRVGDVAVINGQGGVVEALTLRTIVLRGVDGTVHVFPNGSVNTLANQMKDFSFGLLDVLVGQHEDPDRVIEVLTAIASELRADPRYSVNILEPLEVFGIEAFSDAGMTIRIRLKTVPLKQWEIAREFRRRLKKAFEAKGIEIPFPQRTLHLVSRAPRIEDSKPTSAPGSTGDAPP